MASTDLDCLRMIVTGGASGIGLAVTEAALARGATVCVLDLDPTNTPSGATGIVTDVADDESAAVAVAHAAEAMDGIDIVVNNAGIGAQGTVETNTIDEWRHVFDVNVFGIVRITRAALPHLRRSSNPAVVNTCSIAATAGLPDRALYSATKGAVLSLTLAMAADHVGEGIRVNCVNPGTADTPWIGRLLASADDPAAGTGGPRSPSTDGPAGHRRRGGGRDPPPRIASRQRHNRHRAGGRRWHGRTSHATRAAVTRWIKGRSEEQLDGVDAPDGATCGVVEADVDVECGDRRSDRQGRHHRVVEFPSEGGSWSKWRTPKTRSANRIGCSYVFQPPDRHHRPHHRRLHHQRPPRHSRLKPWHERLKFPATEPSYARVLECAATWLQGHPGSADPPRSRRRPAMSDSPRPKTAAARLPRHPIHVLLRPQASRRDSDFRVGYRARRTAEARSK